MAYKGVLDNFRAAIELKTPAKTPIVADSEEFDVRVCGGGITYAEYNSNPKLMAASQIAAVKRFDYDWAWLQVDDCIVYEVLGVEVRGEGNILPATFGYLPATQETLKNLSKPNPHKDGRMPVLLEAIKRVKDEFGDTVCVVGRVEAPFSAVTLLYGIEETMLMPLTDLDLLRDTLEYFVDVQIEFGLAQREAGADAVWVGDCNASGHLMSEQYYSDYAASYVTRLVKDFDKAGLWSIYHASEEKIGHLKLQAATGVSVVSFGPGVDIAEVKSAIGDKVCILGNIDPINVLMNGTPDQVASETERIMNIGKKDGAYIFSSGEMVPRDTPVENMDAMMQTAKSLR